MANKIYEVVSINWINSYLEARETDMAVDDVPDSELWDISFFKDFRIRLVNSGEMGEIVDFAEWVERNSAFGCGEPKALGSGLWGDKLGLLCFDYITFLI